MSTNNDHILRVETAFKQLRSTFERNNIKRELRLIPVVNDKLRHGDSDIRCWIAP